MSEGVGMNTETGGVGARFRVGHRVIVAHWHPGSSSQMGMNGYYGHVVELHLRSGRGSMVSVALQGRVGAPARDHDLDPGDDPWIFYEHELEHAD